MDNYHFISYSSVDALEFTVYLRDELEAESVRVWHDKRDLRPAEDWDEQIAEAIRSCESLFFIMSPDSVKAKSVCKNEWTRALKYKKPVIPILFHRDAEMPFRLGSRQYIDFTRDFDTGIAKLRKHLKWMASPEGMLQVLKDRLEDAERELPRAPSDQQARIKEDITQLEKQIADQKRIIEDPTGVAKSVEKRIASGLERERQPEKPVSDVAHTKFINPPPGIAPTYFQDRHVETKLIGDFLKNDSQLLMTVVGRAGMGKTAMVCRLLKSLENGQLPDEGGALGVDGIVYLSETGSRKVTVPNLYADLCQLLPDDIARGLDEVYKNPKASTEAKIQALLAAFPRGRVILLLDNFENLIDTKTRNIGNAEMNEALRAVLNLPHAVKVILTTRVAPYDLALVHPERQIRLDLDKGLESPYAENILREMDADDKLGLKSASDKLLNEARERTQGNPRALEALFAILSADRDTTLPEILNDTKKSLPEHVIKVLVGEAFSRLDANAQQVMQALAIYARPVTPAAVDYLLQPYLSGVDSAPVLNRLVNMQFVRREIGARYYMHPVDREYALSRVPEGTAADREETETLPFTRFALLHRGAEYFKLIRTPRENWKTIDDLTPQLAEFDLRYAGQDYDTAANVLLEIGFNYLLLWGYFRLMIELHERLLGKLSDAWVKSSSAGSLGTAYSSVGEYRKAIEYLEKALAIDREREDRQGEGTWLGNIGLAYGDLGQVQEAIDYHEKSMVIARETGDRRGEGAGLSNLGLAYGDLGQVQKAIECYEKTLIIAREIGDRTVEGRNLGNIGLAYSDLGQVQKAIEYYKKSLAISQEIGDRYLESFEYTSLGDSFTNQGEWDKAVQYYNRATVIADEIKSVECQHESRYGLARAHFFASNLPDAHATIELACKVDYPAKNHNALVLLGLITLRQGDRKAAKKAFADAIEASQALLKHSGKNYGALDAKGLALCGMALCEEDTRYIKDAINAYKAAREITKDAGIVERVLRLFNEIAKADSKGLLVDVQAFLAQL